MEYVFGVLLFLAALASACMEKRYYVDGVEYVRYRRRK